MSMSGGKQEPSRERIGVASAAPFADETLCLAVAASDSVHLVRGGASSVFRALGTSAARRVHTRSFPMHVCASRRKQCSTMGLLPNVWLGFPRDVGWTSQSIPTSACRQRSHAISIRSKRAQNLRFVNAEF
jgi:hypothetical protein